MAGDEAGVEIINPTQQIVEKLHEKIKLPVDQTQAIRILAEELLLQDGKQVPISKEDKQRTFGEQHFSTKPFKVEETFVPHQRKLDRSHEYYTLAQYHEKDKSSPKVIRIIKPYSKISNLDVLICEITFGEGKEKTRTFIRFEENRQTQQTKTTLWRVSKDGQEAEIGMDKYDTIRPPFLKALQEIYKDSQQSLSSKV